MLPFNQLEEACIYYGSKTGEPTTALGTYLKAHPNSEKLISKHLKIQVLNKRDIRPKHYIPQNIIHIFLNKENEVFLESQQVNTIILASLIQSVLIENYKNNYTKAYPEKFLWLNLKMENNVSYQKYSEVMVALQEAFHLYWEELAFNKYQDSYLELDVQQQWNIRQACPKLITQYDAIELLYIEEKLSKGAPTIWFDIN